ncbi:MAG TPA: glycosyltransferase family 2 protein [Candidatus Binatia bacterium]|nr:glycosyltransferase family 2 protein [Candidatus Binatia bacterium]
MAAPELSIVIVSYNVRDYLRECLRSLRGACGGIGVEIFVADNASRDDSPGMVEREFPEVHLSVNSENLGMAKAVNRVLPLIRGRYALLLNPDTVMPKNSLARLVAVAERWPEAGVIGPLVRDPVSKAVLDTFRAFPTWRDAFFLYTVARPYMRRPRGQPWQPTFDYPTVSGQLLGACLLIRRKLIDEIGGLDPGYFLYYEDTEYCRRAIAAGWKILYTRDVEVFHHQGKSSAQEMPHWIWALHLRGLYRYLVTEKPGTWFRAAAFKLLFLCKVLLQTVESLIKMPAYRVMRRSAAAGRHRHRLKRNAWLLSELMHGRFFT